MSPELSFLLYSAGFALLIYLHFAVAHLAWDRLRGREASDIDMAYVRLEDYFGQSFRSKLQRWRRLPEDGTSNPFYRSVWKGEERLLLGGSAHFPDRNHSDAILVVDGDFTCGPRCTFAREIYVKRDCQIGKHSRLQSIAVDGDLTLGPKTSVVRWADAGGCLELRSEAQVGYRATAGGEIRLNPGARAVSLTGTEVSTCQRDDESVELPAAQPPGSGIILLSPALTPAGARPSGDGLESDRLRALADDCWIYDGDLILGEPLRLQGRLVVRGSLIVPAGSYLEQDVKATEGVSVGHSSVIRGNLVAGGDLWIGSASFFSGVLWAGRNLRLSHTVRGLAESAAVMVYAGNVVKIESNVVIQGKVAAGNYVTAVADEDLFPGS